MPDVKDIDPLVNTTQDLFGGGACDPWVLFRGGLNHIPRFVDPPNAKVRVLAPDYEPFEPTLRRSHNPPRLVQGSFVWGLDINAHAQRGGTVLAGTPLVCGYKVLVEPVAAPAGWRPPSLDFGPYLDPAKDYAFSTDLGRYRDEVDPCDDGFWDLQTYTTPLEE